MYRTFSAAASSASSRAARMSASSVCRTFKVVSNALRYSTSEPVFSPRCIRRPSSAGSNEGSSTPCSCASSIRVSRRSEPSRWTWRSVFGSFWKKLSGSDISERYSGALATSIERARIHTQALEHRGQLLLRDADAGGHAALEPEGLEQVHAAVEARRAGDRGLVVHDRDARPLLPEQEQQRLVVGRRAHRRVDDRHVLDHLVALGEPPRLGVHDGELLGRLLDRLPQAAVAGREEAHHHA